METKTQEEVLNKLIEWYDDNHIRLDHQTNYGIFSDTVNGWEEMSSEEPEYYIIIDGIGYILYLNDYIGAWKGGLCDRPQIERFYFEVGYLATKEEYFGQWWEVEE